MTRFRPVATGRGRAKPGLTALLAGLCGCGAASEPQPPPAVPLPEAHAESGCIDGGRLETRLYGAVDAAIDWPAGPMTCEGMPRPGGEGARLRFAGPHPSGDGLLVFIVAMPALVADGGGAELPTRLTVIEEGHSRFYASPDFDGCWTDIYGDEKLDGNARAIRGRISCIAPLVEVNGSANLTIAEILFTGRIDWDAS